MKRSEIILVLLSLLFIWLTPLFGNGWTFNTPEEYLAAQEKYAKRGEDEKADAIMEEMLEHFPTNSDALFYKAGLLFYSGRDNEAKKYLEKCIKNNPKFADAYAMLGAIYSGENKDKIAEKYLKKAIELDPISEAHANLAELYAAQEKFEDAEKEIEIYFKYAKNPTQADYVVLAYIHKNLGKYDKLIEDCEKGLKVGNPHHLGLLLTLCEAYEKTGQIENAWGQYEDGYSLYSTVYPAVKEFEEGFRRTTKLFAEKVCKEYTNIEKLKAIKELFELMYFTHPEIGELKEGIEKISKKIKELQSQRN